MEQSKTSEQINNPSIDKNKTVESPTPNTDIQTENPRLESTNDQKEEVKDNKNEKNPNAEKDEDPRQLKHRVNKIEEQVQVWRRNRENLNSQVIDKAKIRNERNAEVRTLIDKANKEKKKRDEANKEIQELKKVKQGFLMEIDGFQKKFEALEQKDKDKQINENLAKTGKFTDRFPNVKKIQNEIRELEWKLQTISNLPLDQERAIVDRIATLDKKMEGLLANQELNKGKMEALSAIRNNRRRLRNIINDMNKRVRESRNFHKTMLENYNKANSIRKEADIIHNDIQKIKSEADAIHNEYVSKIKAKRKLSAKLAKMHKQERAKQKEKEQIIIKEKTVDALQRTKEGKKISFDDFRSLIDHGLI